MECKGFGKRVIFVPLASRESRGDEEIDIAQVTGLHAEGLRFSPQAGNCD